MPPLLRIPGAALVALGWGLAAPLHAQALPEPDVAEVAKTPLRDLNIDARDIPEVLHAAERDPYATSGLRKCSAIVAEIAHRWRPFIDRYGYPIPAVT